MRKKKEKVKKRIVVTGLGDGPSWVVEWSRPVFVTEMG